VAHAERVIPVLRTDGGGAAFLDAPGLAAADLVAAVAGALGALDDQVVLTVHTDQPDAPDLVAAWCESADVELLATIDHGADATTLALRRARGSHVGRWQRD
jgi:TusA-related sulfurtransferase